MNVPLFEEHGEVLHHWRAQGWQGATVVCLDRHLDLKALTAGALERIAGAKGDAALLLLNRQLPFEDSAGAPYGLDNFLYAAMRLGWVTRVVWVHPVSAASTPTLLERLDHILLSALSLVASHGGEIRDSFRRTPAGPCAQIGGAELQMTTLALLPLLDLSADTPVDVDLDFFGTEDGRLLHDPLDAAATLAGLGLTRLVSLTASVSSGFLAPALRWVANGFAERLGHVPRSASTRRNPAAGLLRTLAGDGTVTPSSTRRLAQVLPRLGGPGWSLLSVLAVRCADSQLAEHAYWQARKAGDGAHWPAYVRGLSELQSGAPHYALTWFRLAEGALLDTIQLHCLSLQALALARLDRYEDAVVAAQRAVKLTPLRLQPARTGAVCARLCGMHELEHQFAQHGIALERIWNPTH